MNAVAEVSALRFPIGLTGTQVPMEYDAETRAVWAFMQPQGTPCFSPSVMRDIRAADALLEADPGQVTVGAEQLPVSWYVAGSRAPGVYSYGGDLALFVMLARARDRAALSAYARRCIDCLWARISRFGARDLVTISLVQGDALGGGFESVLASDVIIAEAGTRLGFPEILFNLFPGMGAYSLLARRVGAVQAERLITSGETYAAEQLHEMGLVDVIAPEGQGEAAARRWMLKNERRRNGLGGVYAARSFVNPIRREELDAIAETWADAAIRLGEDEFKVMGRFARMQQRRVQSRLAARAEGTSEPEAALAA